MNEMRDAKVLVVDPGLETGVLKVLILDGVIARVEAFEMDIRSFWRMCFDELNTYTNVVCETFIINAETGKKTPAPWSLELIGLLRAMCWRAGVKFDMQKPGDAHEFDHDSGTTKCRLYGLWVRGGAGHAKMAAKHFVLWACGAGGFGLAILKARDRMPALPLTIVHWDDS